MIRGFVQSSPFASKTYQFPLWDPSKLSENDQTIYDKMDEEDDEIISKLQLQKSIDHYLEFATAKQSDQSDLRDKTPLMEEEEKQDQKQIKDDIQLKNEIQLQISSNPITITLFKQFMEKIKSKCSPSKHLRDSLLYALHNYEGLSIQRLGQIFKLKLQTVKQILKEFINQPPPTLENIQQLITSNQSRAETTHFIERKIQSNEEVIKIPSLQEEIQITIDPSISYAKIKRIMQKEQGLKWKRTRGQDAYVNYDKNIRLKKIFTNQMLLTIYQQKKIINFDESILDSTCNKKFSWDKKHKASVRRIGKSISSLQILLAITNDGLSFFQYVDGPNNEVSVASFFVQLAAELDSSIPQWRETYVLVLDNCASHKTDLMLSVLKAGGFSVIFSAPASYLSLLVEGIFGLIKGREYDTISTPQLLSVHEKNIRKLSNKQRLMIKVSEYLLGLQIHTIQGVFRTKLLGLHQFLSREKV